MYNFSTTITNEGAALLARIIANHENASFKEARMSETNYVGQEATLTAGTFGGVKYTDPTIAASVIDSTTIKVALDFRGSGLIGEYNLYSIGIIIDDNGTDVLVAVCTSSDPLPIGEEFNDRYAFNVNLAVSSTQNITVTGTSAAVIYDTDVIDTLISTATNKPLSANQGRLIGDNLAANENVYGAKNENAYPYEDTTKADSGITFTDNGDGSVTVSGTAGANTQFNCHHVKRLTLSQGKHKINGCPAGGSGAWYINITEYINGVYSTIYTVDENGVEITADNTKSYGVYIWVANGTAISTPITFYPMIRDARILDPTFAPYAKTNLQLTNDKAERADLATIHATGSTNTTGSTIANGTFFYLNGQFCKALTNIAANATFTENTNYKKDTVNGAIADLHKNQIAASASTDISSYTSTSNAFEVPADGYVILNALTTPGGSSSLTVYGSDISSSTNFVVSLINPTGNYQGTCAFVRKGMHVVCADLQAGHAAYYDPLT